jgi:hypothetical protein
MDAMLEVIYRKTDDIIPYVSNSRTHSEAQIAQIAASVREFGFTNPILIDEEGGVIAGHGRIMAARKLGMAEVPTITLEGLSKAQKRAYVIADNKLALNAGWDEETLKIEIEELADERFDLALTGFSQEELANLFDEDTESGLLADEKYTAKIQIPIYEIKGKKPSLEEVFNTSKYEYLLKKIESSDIPDDLTVFLRAAAARHIVFNYENIAELYAHQPPEVQELFEDSALVIIDYNKAIECGYVKLTKALMELSGDSDDV